MVIAGVQCPQCSAQLKSPAKLQAHIAKVHAAQKSRRKTRRRRDTVIMNPQIPQHTQNLPIPAAMSMRKTRGRGRTPGYRGAISAAVDSRIDKILTPDGADFVHRSCHPNDDARAGGVFIPDDTTADRAILESRPYAVIQYPGATTPTPTNWDVMVCVTSLSDIPFVYRWRNSGDDNADWSPWIAPSSDNFVQHGSITGVAPVPDAGPTEPKVTRTPSLLNDATQFRQAFKGVTIVMNCSTLYDQGYVTAGQWGNKAKVVNLVPTSYDALATTGSKVEALVYDEVPYTMSDIISACPEYGQWEAKKGIYMPMRYDDPVHQFNGGVSNALTPPNLADEQKSGAPIMLASRNRTRNPDFGSDYFPLYGVFTTKGTGGTVDVIPTTAGDVNQTFGVILFSGIDYRSQLILKCRLGLDLVPSPRSPYAAMAKKGPVKDQLALDLATSIQSKLPVVYEHKFNSLSMIVPWIGKAAMAVLPTLAPWVGSKITQGLDWLGTKIRKAVNPDGFYPNV